MVLIIAFIILLLAVSAPAQMVEQVYIVQPEIRYRKSHWSIILIGVTLPNLIILRIRLGCERV